MNYKYNKRNNTENFHKNRIAFIIYKDNIEYIKNSNLSHWEYCKKKGLSREEFSKLTRGYYLNESIVFYKDNFIYDNEVINEGLKYIKKIMLECCTKKVKVYFGVKIDEKVTIWPYDYYYGEITI